MNDKKERIFHDSVYEKHIPNNMFQMKNTAVNTVLRGRRVIEWLGGRGDG
jgi:hypothetical protein